MTNKQARKQHSEYPDRRTILAGLAGLALAVPARGESVSPVAHGVLANNPLAQTFEAARGELPDVMLTGPNGNRPISELNGRTILMPLWAEWCTPCLSELPDFARLQQRYGNASFAIVPVLTGARKKLTPAVVTELLGYLQAGVFEALIEINLGARLMNTMAAVSPSETELPCNLLIAPSGHVVGREIGAKRDADQDAIIAAARKESGKGNAVIAQAESGTSLSLWGKDAGAEFASALANGFLSQN